MTELEIELDEAVEQAAAHLRALEDAAGRALVGQRQVIREAVVALVAAGHCLLEGVPGVGKTLLVRSLAAAIDGHFARIQFTPDLMPSDVTGHALFDLKTEEFRIRRGPIFCNLLLGDEINRAPAKTQSALLEAMQEQQVTIEGQPTAAARPLPGLCDPEPDRAGRHLPPAAGATRPLSAQGLHRLSGGGG